MLDELPNDVKKAANGGSQVPKPLLRTVKVEAVRFLHDFCRKRQKELLNRTKKKKDFQLIHTSTLTLV